MQTTPLFTEAQLAARRAEADALFAQTEKSLMIEEASFAFMMLFTLCIITYWGAVIIGHCSAIQH